MLTAFIKELRKNIKVCTGERRSSELIQWLSVMVQRGNSIFIVGNRRLGTPPFLLFGNLETNVIACITLNTSRLFNKWILNLNSKIGVAIND